jgi:sugar transferase EpsL
MTGTYVRFLKRWLDVAGAVLGVVLLAPLMLAVALLIRVRLGTPVVYRQSRPGLNGRSFTLLKFRTMLPERNARGRLLTDAERVTRLSLFLRATSLDELPQLVNILRGDMSFVGPRPLLERYLPYYTVSELRRHTVRPGLTGWAQVQGRNDLDWDVRLAMDVWYVDHLSLRLDLRILLRTIVAVLTRRGAREHPSAVLHALDDARRGDKWNLRLHGGSA